MKKGMKRALVIGAVVLVAGAGGLLVYSRMAAKMAAVPTAAPEPAEIAIPVEVAAPQTGDLAVETEFIGRVQPGEVVNILPKMAGTVLDTYFEVGDSVKKGDLLFELDPSDLETTQAQVRVAEASYNAAKVSAEQTLGSRLDLQLLQTDTGLRTAQNAYDNAKKSLEDYDRDGRIDDLEETVDETYGAFDTVRTQYNTIDALLKQKQKEAATIGYSSGLTADIADLTTKLTQLRSTYDQAQAIYEQAKAAYDAARDGDDVQYTNLRNALRSASISLESAEETKDITENKTVDEAKVAVDAQLEQARASYESSLKAYEKQLEYTRITSPIDGVIEQKSVERNGLVSQQSPAYIVSNKDIMVVKFGVPASAAGVMGIGDTVRVENGSAVYDGAIIEISQMVDSQSGLFPVKARVDAPEGALLTGVAVKVTASTQKAEGALLIPVDSLYHEDGGAYLYTMSPDGTAVKTPVETGITNDETVEILSGLTPESKVITSWNPNLLDGAKVAAAAEAAASAPAASGGGEAGAAGSAPPPESTGAPSGGEE